MITRNLGIPQENSNFLLHTSSRLALHWQRRCSGVQFGECRCSIQLKLTFLAFYSPFVNVVVVHMLSNRLNLKKVLLSEGILFHIPRAHILKEVVLQEGLEEISLICFLHIVALH